jgi:PAS domain S-box-containing protein
LSEAEIIGRRDEDLLSPDSAQRLTSIKRQVLDTGLGLRQEIEVLHSDQTANYDITIDPLWDEQNAIVGIACAAVNITDRVRLEAERLQAEATLLENERLLRLALSGANAGSWSWEVATCKMNWSPENCVLYGFNPAQGSPSFDAWFNTIHPEDQDRVNRDIANVIEQRFPTYRSEFRIHHPQKGTRWMLGQGRLTLDDQGNPTRLSGINLDITDQKTAAARQEELLQREQAARAEAERANRVKDEFLAILSHELRSPLNPILGWSKLLQQKQFAPEKTQQALTTIERNAKLQTQLIDDLLDIARILRGKLNLKTAPVDLSFVIQSAMETVKPAAEAKSIDIQYNSASADSELQETSLQVTGDEARLQQIIWNLLSNAIKFTPSGGQVEVCLEAVREQEREAARERDGERVEWRDSQVVGPTNPPPLHPSTLHPTHAQITVTDTGKGINPDFLPHLFESFRQEDISITRQYGGLGLGLAIVRYLVEAHGGTITADSPGEGLGATFTITLPLLRNHGSDQEVAKTQPKGYDLQGIRVLAVDDDPDTRELLRAVLTFYGADVRIVSSAAEALTQWQILQPDILLSDLGMPDITGYDLIQQIRALPSPDGQQVPAIALSAYAREGDHQRSLAWGFQQHIAKPLELDNLVQSIAKLVQRIP